MGFSQARCIEAICSHEIDVGTRHEQRSHDLSMASFGGQHQRGASVCIHAVQLAVDCRRIECVHD